MSTFALNPAATVATPVSGVTSAQPVIPYRTTAPVSTVGFVAALAITALVLAALVGCVAYARRRGWLLGVDAGKRTGPGTDIEVRATRRVSMTTTAYIVAYREHEYLVVESGRGYVTTVSPLNAPRVGQGKTP